MLVYALYCSVTSRSNKWRWDYFFCRISVCSKNKIHWVNFFLEKNYLCIKLLNFGRCSLVDSLFLYVFALVFYISCSKIQNLRWITIENRYLYRVSHIKMFLLNWLWQIQICKLDFVWRYLYIPEVKEFEFHQLVSKK